MKRQRHTFASSTSGIEVVHTDDGSRTLRKVGASVTWHSESGAVSESQLVFLENSGVARRIAAGEPTSVFEVGFGTGLNFWLTASLAQHHQSHLTYQAVEPHLMGITTIRELRYDDLASCQNAYDDFATQIYSPTGGLVRNISQGTVSINLACCELEKRLENNDLSGLDAVYFDPFDPAEAPELWRVEVFEKLYSCLRPRGRLATYCVKSRIQRALESVGFEVNKTRGPVGGKREVLFAQRPA